MVKHGDTLFLHADAMFYVELGRTVDAVNQKFWEILADTTLLRWETTLRAFSEHRAFSALGMTGLKRAEQLLPSF